MHFDADLGVEVEAIDARLAAGGQVHDVGRVRLGAACARGGGEGLGEGELVVVERVVVAFGEQSVSG